MSTRWPVLLTTMVLLVGCFAALTGCASTSSQTLYQPYELRSPYPRSSGEALWAVVPPTNETGTTLAQTDAVGDALVASIQQTRGLSSLPMNRTIAAMRSLDMTAVTTPAQARALARAMNVDGLLIPVVTAWDPYDPPKIGLTVALHLQQEEEPASLNVRDLTTATSDFGSARARTEPQPPAAVTSLHLDARNHATLASLRAFAVGRHDDQSAAGWRSYVLAMPKYVEFAAHEAIADLLSREHARLAPVVVAEAAEDQVAGGVAEAWARDVAGQSGGSPRPGAQRTGDVGPRFARDGG